MGGEGTVRSEVGCGTTCALYLPRFEGTDRATDEGEPELIDSEHFVRWISLIKSRESFRDKGPPDL
jgi:hypothetical protein